MVFRQGSFIAPQMTEASSNGLWPQVSVNRPSSAILNISVPGWSFATFCARFMMVHDVHGLRADNEQMNHLLNSQPDLGLSL